MDNNLLNSIKAVLEYRREHKSEGEQQFITDYIMPLDPTELLVGGDGSEVAGYMLEIPNKDPNKKSKILWSSHIDTMHRGRGDVIKQEIIVDAMGMASVPVTADCLGADDGAGVWLMLEMYKAGVEGTYIFHRGEEKGCIGSKAIKTGHEDLLKKHTHAIAFDRRALTSVITFQRSRRCCSDEFGNQFAEFLGMGYKLDDTGVYTDTAEYVNIIPECSNISTGYYSEHSHHETLDLEHLLKLREVLTNAERINAIDFVAVRDPSTEERKVFQTKPLPPSSPSLFDYDWGKVGDTTTRMPAPPTGIMTRRRKSRHQQNRGKSLSQRRSDAWFDCSELPEIEDMQEAKSVDIAEWVDLAGPEMTTILIEELLSEIDVLTNERIFGRKFK